LDAPAATGAGAYAIRVRLVDLQNPLPVNAPCCPAPNFSAFEGQDRWVGPPAEYPESAENPSGPKFRAALLRCTPHYRKDWHTYGVIHVAGAEVMPSSVYLIHTVAQAGGLTSTSGLTVTMARWGDVVSPFCVHNDLSGCPSFGIQPDFVDISAVVDKFKSTPTSVIRARAQLQPRVPVLADSVSFLDISACVDAFKGVAFPGIWGPCSCPSGSTCPTLDGCNRCTPEP